MSPVVVAVLITAGGGLIARLGALVVSAYIVRVTHDTRGLRDLATVVLAFSHASRSERGRGGDDGA